MEMKFTEFPQYVVKTSFHQLLTTVLPRVQRQDNRKLKTPVKKNVHEMETQLQFQCLAFFSFLIFLICVV